MPLAGYLLARALDGRKVEVHAVGEGDDFERLRRADESVREARALLPFGRGNVVADIHASGGQSTTRTEASRELRESAAAAAIWAGAGNCGEHGILTATAHAARLHAKSMETINRYGNSRTDHCWAEAAVQPPLTLLGLLSEIWKPKPTDRDIVLDAWKDGPAVFGPDSTRSPREWRGAEVGRLWADPEALSNAKRTAQDLAGTRDPRQAPERRYVTRDTWNSEPVVDEAFLKRALTKPLSVMQVLQQVMRDPHAKPERRPLTIRPELRKEIIAAGVARELMAPPDALPAPAGAEGRVKTAAAQAPEIIEAMKNLRQITPRGGSAADVDPT